MAGPGRIRGKGFFMGCVFDSATFPTIDKDDLASQLEGIQQETPEGLRQGVLRVYTMDESSILVVPGELFKKVYTEACREGGTFEMPFAAFQSRLGQEPHLSFVPLNTGSRPLSLKRDFLEIDRVVSRFQAAFYLNRGVIFEDYNGFYIEGLPSIGGGARISTGVVIKGNSHVGSRTHLYPNVYMENSKVGDDCVVLPGCVLRESSLERLVTIGPYAHLRNGALVKEGAKMGNFVEMKKSVLGRGSKAMHLSYIGDAEVGEKVNIGAGTITCNYDGVNKNKTIIEDNVFIGSGTELVAPVAIRKNAYVGAGSTITQDVPEDSLGVARERQRNVVDWVNRKNRKR